MILTAPDLEYSHKVRSCRTLAKASHTILAKRYAKGYYPTLTIPEKGPYSDEQLFYYALTTHLKEQRRLLFHRPPRTRLWAPVLRGHTPPLPETSHLIPPIRYISYDQYLASALSRLDTAHQDLHAKGAFGYHLVSPFWDLLVLDSYLHTRPITLN